MKPTNLTMTSHTSKHQNIDSCKSPLLTLYTTFKNVNHKNMSSINVVKNWSQLHPCVRTVLFIQNDTDPYIISLAREYNWTIDHVPKQSSPGVPVFKDMYFRAKELTNSLFHGFCNGDILFDQNFIFTLKTVSRSILSGHPNSSYLVVGRRKNYKYNNQPLYNLDEVEKVGSSLPFFRIDAEDYFLISGDSFPWHKIPDVVIGRPGEYSNV